MSLESFEERLVWLLQISRSMLATRDLDRLLTLITDAFIEITEGDRGVLLLKNRSTGELRQHVGRLANRTNTDEEKHQITTIANQVLTKNKPVFATDASVEIDLATRRSIKSLNIKMMVCVPLSTETEALGAIYADGSRSLDKVFSQTNSRTFEMLADHAAAAIENARLFERASNDPLTGLPNNSYFLFQLAKVMRETTPEITSGILLLDLDCFKRVNAAAGAEMGDRALVDIAETLQETLRADGLVARYGSDKFAILLPAESDEKISLRLRDVAERARAAISTKIYHGIPITASIGGVSYPGPKVVSAPDLIALADDVLARARARGTGQIEID